MIAAQGMADAPAHVNTDTRAYAPAARAHARRGQRAATAARLMARSPQSAAALDWALLDAMPEWLAWPEADAARYQCQVGALLCAPVLRLWIDAPRLAAAKAAVGAPFLHTLLALPGTQILPLDAAPCPRMDAADQVAPMLRTAGIEVLLAALPAGPLRRAVAALMAPAAASQMASALAQSLAERAAALAREAA